MTDQFQMVRESLPGHHQSILPEKERRCNEDIIVLKHNQYNLSPWLPNLGKHFFFKVLITEGIQTRKMYFNLITMAWSHPTTPMTGITVIVVTFSLWLFIYIWLARYIYFFKSRRIFGEWKIEQNFIACMTTSAAFYDHKTDSSSSILLQNKYKSGGGGGICRNL